MPTIVGTGFGTNIDYAPIKFLDMIGRTPGEDWLSIGGDDIESGSVGVIYNLDGLPVGGGCYRSLVNLPLTGGPEYFSHESINVGSLDAVTVFKHIKVIHVSGTPVEQPQVKGTRLCTSTGTTGAYGAIPRVADSEFTFVSGVTSTDLCQPHYWPSSTGSETNFGGEAFDIQKAQWISTFTQAKMNTSAASTDGFARVWMQGVNSPFMGNATNLNIRNNTSIKFRSIQPNPGLANGYRGCVTDVRHSRIVVLKGLAWAAIGNSSTFAGVTDLLVVEPTGWSSTSIPYNMRGTRPSGYDWYYVSDTGGNINSAGIPVSASPPTFLPSYASRSNQTVGFL